jgi:hypothetical protein
MADGPIRVLWLGNSDDLGDFVPLEARAHVIAAGLVERELGRPVELTVRATWPHPDLPGIVDGWMARYRPELVMFKVNAYWYLYKSVPLKLERSLPWAGRLAASAGAAAGRRRWITERRLFHAGRSLLLRTIGGATPFSVQEVVETVEVVTRRLLQAEGTSIVLHPTLDRWTSNPYRQKEAHDAIKAFAAGVHVTYLGADPFDPADAPPKDFYAGRDRLHSNREAAAWLGVRQANALLEAWRQTRAT